MRSNASKRPSPDYGKDVALFEAAAKRAKELSVNEQQLREDLFSERTVLQSLQAKKKKSASEHVEIVRSLKDTIRSLESKITELRQEKNDLLGNLDRETDYSRSLVGSLETSHYIICDLKDNLERSEQKEAGYREKFYQLAPQLEASRAQATASGEEAQYHKKSARLLASLMEDDDYKCAICQYGMDARDRYPQNRCCRCNFVAHGHCHDLSQSCPICSARVGPPPPPLADMESWSTPSPCRKPIILE